MKKRLWFLVCLTFLEVFFSWSEWRYSLRLAQIHRDGLALHRQSEAVQKAAAKSEDAAQALDARAWALISEGQQLRESKLLWQVLSLADMTLLIGVGIWSLRVSHVETLRRSEAEAELRKEQASLEQKIEARTTELRAEVEERRRAEERNRRQKRVLELQANGATLEEMFRELTASIAGQRNSWQAAVHLADTRQQTLELVATSGVSDWLEDYLKTIAIDFPDAPESTAWTSGRAHFIEATADEHRPWSEFLASNAIRSAWSLPLKLGDGVTAGTLTVYCRLFGLPNEDDRELLDAAVRLATLVLDVHRMNRELQRKAYEDELTGVANRRAGENRLRDAIARAQTERESFAVLWIDLDRFKRINDLYGHSCGDLLLMESAKRISSHARVRGSVARMGGDEFLVLLEPCSTDEDAQQIASEIAHLIGAPMDLAGETASVGASIGITIFPRDGETPEELERYADSAMYQAKRRRLGWCTFSPKLRKESEWKLAIEEGLRAALDPERETGLLQLQYQPILTHSGEVLAFEALLRFTHQELGPVSPAQFIPIAEESNLINRIGRWVMQEACRQIRAWELAGVRDVRVGVNISAVQWGREDFVVEVRELVRSSGIAAKLLTLELTESAVMQNPVRAREHMRQLKAMGVRLAIDDFGTGYSSLSYLHQLPLDILKIDRSFVARLALQDDSRAIVESVISMAHLLGIKTVAEGVETSVQRNLLATMRCDAMQGFLFSRPIGADDAANFMRLAPKKAFVAASAKPVFRRELPVPIEPALA